MIGKQIQALVIPSGDVEVPVMDISNCSYMSITWPTMSAASTADVYVWDGQGDDPLTNWSPVLDTNGDPVQVTVTSGATCVVPLDAVYPYRAIALVLDAAETGDKTIVIHRA